MRYLTVRVYLSERVDHPDFTKLRRGKITKFRYHGGFYLKSSWNFGFWILDFEWAGALFDGPLIFMVFMINYDRKYLFKLNLS